MFDIKKINFLTVLVAFVVGLGLAVGVGVMAYSGNSNIVIEGDYIEASQQADGFSGVVFEDEDFTEGLSVDGNKVINSYGEFMSDDGNLVWGEVRIDMTRNTSSATQLVSDIPGVDADGDQADSIYVYDAYYVIEDTATTTSEILLGTSSVAFLSPDQVCGTTDICGGTTGGEASILITGDIAGSTATSTPYFKQDYQGTDTRDGSGTRFVVPVLESEYLSVFASTTIIYYTNDETRSLIDGYAVYKYYYYEGS